MTNRYILFNGKLSQEATFVLPHPNRGFLYGDGLYESMCATGSNIYFFDRHFARLSNGLEALGFEPTTDFSKEKLFRQITQLLNKQRNFTLNRIRLTVWRNPGGKFAPTDNGIMYMALAEPIEGKPFELNHNGMLTDLCTQIGKEPSVFSRFKTLSSINYVLAADWAKRNNLDDAILLNHRGELVESTSSNLFLVFGKTIITPPLSSGCIEGVMRGIVIKIASEVGFEVIDSQPVYPHQINNADEMFLTNGVKGIQWVLGYGRKRFFNTVTKLIASQLLTAN